MKKQAEEGLHELVAMRVLIGHWPEAEYIIRGISVTYGDDVAKGVRRILEERRSGVAKELRALERKYGASLKQTNDQRTLTKAEATRQDSGTGLPGGRKGESTKDARASRRGAEGRAEGRGAEG
ncbi:MAG: hypothetical protein J0L91_00060 [Burkholderiales bacterium]|nr:hypothetical protein [Burkholderiales bacterium]